MGNSILIADDDSTFLKVAANYFTHCGFKVYSALTVKDSLDLLSRHAPDCYLLDYHLADDTAQFLCQAIRFNESTKGAPIVILSGDEAQEASCYDLCDADVFLLKGRGYRAALAAVTRHLRRAEADAGIVRRSDVVLDAARLCLVPAGKDPITISLEQFRFFSVIFENGAKFVSEAAVARRVFLKDFDPEMRKALNMLAYRLRKKLGPRLGRRIKKSKSCGWIYMPPREKKPSTPPTINKIANR